MIGWTRASLIAAALSFAWPVDAAQAQARGRFPYLSVGACMSAGKVPVSWCENAAANARAEFEEKAAHYSSRGSCEKAHGAGRCSVAFSKGGVVFTQRQDGFVIVVRSPSDASVTPGARGVAASPRSVLHRNVSIDPRASHAAPVAREEKPDPATQQTFGVAEPDAPLRSGPLPPPVKFDPNFNCSAYLEPSAKGDGSIGCYPAPARRTR